MMHLKAGMAGTVAALAMLAPKATADLTYLLQERSIEAATSFDNNVQTVISPGFGSFVERLDLAAPFPAVGGGTGLNRAAVGIDCQLDPNAIRVVGSLLGAGGLAVVGGNPTLQSGEAEADVEVRFRLDQATPYTMLASARPGTRPGDRFQIKLKNQTTGVILFSLDQTVPPQAVNTGGTLPPGEFELEYEVELTFDGPESLRDFHFHFLLPGATTCSANCDGSTTPPVLNINDFVCFQTLFAQGSPSANCDSSTTAPVLNVGDFVCFQARFAAGCSAP